MKNYSDKQANKVILEAPAKINLSLLITGRRADGYHTLDSLIVFAETHDRITISPNKGLAFKICGPFRKMLASDQNNSILQAANLIVERTGVKPNASIILEKNLPVASGIGGGSSNAAAAIHGLNQFWKTGLNNQEVREIGLSIGTDVPVCLLGLPARVSGIGENIEILSTIPSFGLLLVNPGAAVSTSEVFRLRSGSFSREVSSENIGFKNPQALANYLIGLRNDLEVPARKVCPQIADVLKVIGATEECLLSRLSGSGATCFGIFKNQAAASAAADKICSKYPAWWVNSTIIRNGKVFN